MAEGSRPSPTRTAPMRAVPTGYAALPKQCGDRLRACAELRSFVT